MVDEKFVELIHQEIDAENSPDETAKLKAYLAQNTEARKLYDDLAVAANMLREVKAVEPPSTLKKSILRSIQPDRYIARAKKSAPGGIRNLVDMLFGAPSYQLKYAYTFAFGLMAGLFIYALMSNTNQQQAGIDNSNLYGTLAWLEAAGNFASADSMAVDLEAGRVSMQVKSSPKQVIAELHLNTIKETTIQLEFEENDLGFSGVSQSNSQAGVAFNRDEHVLKLTTRGENRYVIAFANKAPTASSLRFKLFVSDTLQYETTLATAKL
ncbi:MAG: anti-sigma factor family protein [bacterium]